MTGLEAYTALQFWLPLVAAFGLAYRIYRSVTTGVSGWADKLLYNHLTHIQDNTERTVSILASRDFASDVKAGVVDLASVLKDIHVAEVGMLAEIKVMREDFSQHAAEDMRVQTELLRDIAILKVKAE